MSIIKEKVKKTNSDIVIKFPINSGIEFTGKQQEINKLTDFNTFDVVNPPVDGEKIRFKYGLSSGIIAFEFYNDGIDFFTANLKNTVFTVDEVNKRSSNVRNSFFIMDVYDSFDAYSQNKIFSSYLSKITYYNNGEPIFFLYDKNVQWNKIAVPNEFIRQQTTNQITAYAKFTFYSAKTGNLTPFFNFNNNNLTTPEKYYIKIIFNVLNNTYEFQTTNINNIRFREITETENPSYYSKINNTVNNFNEININYPVGNTFNSNERDYETT